MFETSLKIFLFSNQIGQLRGVLLLKAFTMNDFKKRNVSFNFFLSLLKKNYKSFNTINMTFVWKSFAHLRKALERVKTVKPVVRFFSKILLTST